MGVVNVVECTILYGRALEVYLLWFQLAQRRWTHPLYSSQVTESSLCLMLFLQTVPCALFPLFSPLLLDRFDISSQQKYLEYNWLRPSYQQPSWWLSESFYVKYSSLNRLYSSTYSTHTPIYNSKVYITSKQYHSHVIIPRTMS